MFKYQWRVSKFLENYKNKTPFELHNGIKVTFVLDPEIVKRIESETKRELVGEILTNENGSKYRLGDLKKTAEFGGKGKGFSIRIEQQEIARINIQLENIKMANNLSPYYLTEYDWRIKIFLDHYKSGQPFEFTSGPKKSLVYSEQIAEKIRKKKVADLQGPIFLGKNGKSYAIKDLKMTNDFKDYVGFGTEVKEIKSTVNQLQEAKSKLASGIVPIKIGGETYEVSTIQKTPGSLKSDFHFINQMNREIVWVSHKDGKKAIDFQQWSGMTESAIEEEKEVQDFIASVKLIYPLGIDQGKTVARKIESKTLRLKSVYGVGYGGPYGKQNVTLVAQGPIDIKSEGRYYKICSNHVMLNGEDPKGDFEPVMMAVYKGDRSQYGVKGARFTIQPLGSRKINDFI